jgi:hypothetical protein
MAKARAETKVAKSADEVWAVIGRFEDMTWWHHPAESSRTEGGIRYITPQGGAETSQREYHRDEAQRTYTYGLHSYGGGIIQLPGGKTFDMNDMVGRHRAKITVTPAGPSACVVSMDVEIEDGYDLLLQPTASGYQDALNHLKKTLES